MANSSIKQRSPMKFSKKSKSSRKLAKKSILKKEFNNLKGLIPVLKNKQKVDEVS